ncbi:hypothetical protein HHK36_000248 [Tetracentron sinense]|uniref:Protein FAR1-RELATED SEQUENCE n=1 Tax=Tetracentron sinense TaxID=13715 RepID=A0A834ZTS5_TETSI|nr:hypothetical protein HHK36_000248 [Tetracentron sinense]
MEVRGLGGGGLELGSKTREEYLGILAELSRCKEQLKGELDNLRLHYDKMKAFIFNLQLKAREQEGSSCRFIFIEYQQNCSEFEPKAVEKRTVLPSCLKEDKVNHRVPTRAVSSPKIGVAAIPLLEPNDVGSIPIKEECRMNTLIIENCMLLDEGEKSDEIGTFKKYYEEYGRRKGFSIRVRSSDKTRGRVDEVTGVKFVCLREGNHKKMVVEATSENTGKSCSTLKCGCMATMRIMNINETTKWKVTRFSNEHNHKFVTPRKRVRMRCNRNMPDAAKDLTKIFSRENLQVCKVASIFHGDKIGFDGRDCWNHLRATYNIEEFEDGWKALMVEYDLVENDWLQHLYEIQRSWVPVYNRSIFFAGMNTTGRSEGVNAFFDSFVSSNTNLRDFVLKYDQALKKIVDKEESEDYISEHKNRIVDNNNLILKHAAKIYTRNIFEKFRHELEEVIRYKVLEGENGGEYQTYIVKSKVGISEEFIVKLKLDTYEGMCGCQHFEFTGLLCRHILKVFARFDVDEIPTQFILKRWMQEANKARVVGTDEITMHDTQSSSEAMRQPYLSNFNSIGMCRFKLDWNFAAARKAECGSMYSSELDKMSS